MRASISNHHSTWREVRRGSLLEVRDQMEEVTEPQDYRLHKPLASFQLHTVPFLLQHTTHAQVTDAEQEEASLSLPVTYLEPIYFGSQPTGQNGRSSITAS